MTATEGEPGEEPVGSLAEETLKLFGALFAQGAGADPATWAERASAAAHDLNEHVATGGAECQFCPLCRAIALIRDTSPEVKAHLTSAASSLLQAAAGALAAAPDLKQEHDARRAERSAPVEHIDLDEDDT